MRRVICWYLAGLGMATPVQADQHLMVADNGTVECAVSQRDLTRLALINDAFASVSKVGTGQPYNDFSVQHEPVRGDLYLSIPELYAPRSVSFFATTAKGFTYKFLCRIIAIGAEQVFLTNPAIAEAKAAKWERQTPEQATVVRLMQAMYARQVIEGYRLIQPPGGAQRRGDLRLRVASLYEGASLAGRVVEIRNTGRETVPLAESLLASPHALAVAYGREALGPGETTLGYLVEKRGQ